MADRQTKIYSDQIADHDIGAEELNTDKIGSARKKWMVLTYKVDTDGQMMWVFNIDGRIFD